MKGTGGNGVERQRRGMGLKGRGECQGIMGLKGRGGMGLKGSKELVLKGKGRRLKGRGEIRTERQRGLGLRAEEGGGGGSGLKGRGGIRAETHIGADAETQRGIGG